MYVSLLMKWAYGSPDFMPFPRDQHRPGPFLHDTLSHPFFLPTQMTDWATKLWICGPLSISQPSPCRAWALAPTVIKFQSRDSHLATHLISFPTLARPWPTTIRCVRLEGGKGFSRENSAPLCVTWLFPLTSTKAKSLSWQKLGEKRKRTYFFMIHNCKPISICYNHMVLVNNSNGLKGLHSEKIKSSPPWIVLKKKHFLGPPSLPWCASLERPSTVWLRSQISKPVLPGVLLPGFWKQALGLTPTWHIFWAHPKSTWQRDSQWGPKYVSSSDNPMCTTCCLSYNSFYPFILSHRVLFGPTA